MPDKFVVPQFIDAEDKILGPVTVRQFLVCLVATFALFIEYKLLSFIWFILWAVITAGLAGTFGFLKINGQPFHLFFVNVLQTYTRPFLRVWHKELSTAELNILLAKKPVVALIAAAKKQTPSSTRLRDLSLTVNTGGVYNPDEEDSA